MTNNGRPDSDPSVNNGFLFWVGSDASTAETDFYAFYAHDLQAPVGSDILMATEDYRSLADNRGAAVSGEPPPMKWTISKRSPSPTMTSP